MKYILLLLFVYTVHSEYKYKHLGCYTQVKGHNGMPLEDKIFEYGYEPDTCTKACLDEKKGYKYMALVNQGLCTCGAPGTNYGRFGARGGCVDGKGVAWGADVYEIEEYFTYTQVGYGYCQDTNSTRHLCNYHIGTSYGMNPYSDSQCQGYCDQYTGCMGWTNMRFAQGGCFLYFLATSEEVTKYPHHLPGFRSCGARCATNANSANHEYCKSMHGFASSRAGGIADVNNVHYHTCQRKVGAAYDPPPNTGCHALSARMEQSTSITYGNAFNFQNGGVVVAVDASNNDNCIFSVEQGGYRKMVEYDPKTCSQVSAGYLSSTTTPNWNDTTTWTKYAGYWVFAVSGCTPKTVPCPVSEFTGLNAACLCDAETTECAIGKWCYDGGCKNEAKYPACPVDFQTPLTTTCACGAGATTSCAVGQWCYEGSCKATAKCGVRSEVHKNLFYGAKVYGSWNATTRKMYMNFTTPWDITVNSIKWKNAPATTLQYLKASAGLWTVDKTTNPCAPTYALDIPQTTFFGTGSKFKITGSQLSTNLRVDASETIKTVHNGETYTYNRHIKNSVPVLVNLVTKTTISVRFRSTAATQGPGPAPALEDFVLFISAEDNFADETPNVIITMQVHSRSCVDHALSDTGVRVKTGGDNIKTGSTQLFKWKKDSSGNIIKDFQHNLCVETLEWTFVPKKYKENTYEIELEFDNRDLPQKFTTIAAIDIKQGDVLSDIGFTSAIDTYSDEACTAKESKFILGGKFYTKISLTDLIVDTNNITCNTYKIKQTKNGVTTTTDMKAEVKYAFMEKKATLNNHICGAELESHHFHVSVDGYDTLLETEIIITYDQTNTRRHLLQIPLSGEMIETEVGASFDDGIEEVGVGVAKYDQTDQEFRSAKREPDQDDMIVEMFIEAEDAKSTAVGQLMGSESSRMFLSLSFCVILVGAVGFIFGYSQTKGKEYHFIPDNKSGLLVEMQ